MDSKGYSLVELLAVLVILGMISVITVLSLDTLIKKSKEEVCQANRIEIDKSYQVWLLSKNTTHSEMTFTTYLLELQTEPCPENGILIYTDGKISCSVHDVDNEEDSENDEIPFL